MEREAVLQFLTTHGNHLHARTVSALREKGWAVLVSPHYRDNATDKAREADIIAEKDFEVKHFGTYKGYVRLRLVIECKYSNDETMIWFDKKDEVRVLNLITRSTPLMTNNIYITDHHWHGISDVAKLFGTMRGGSQERVTENEMFFSALDKILNTAIYYRGDRTVIPEKKDKPPLVPLITYPVIVLNSFANLYRTTINAPQTYESLEPFSVFQAEVNYAYIIFGSGTRLNRREYFLVDIARLDKFDSFLAEIQKDVDAILKIQ